MAIFNGYGSIAPYGRGNYKGDIAKPKIKVKLLIEQYNKPMINRQTTLSFEEK